MTNYEFNTDWNQHMIRLYGSASSIITFAINQWYLQGPRLEDLEPV